MDKNEQIYRAFEEFEREELRKAEVGERKGAYDWDGYFGEEPDFGSAMRTQSLWDDDLD